jgi:hypothetical protein
MKALEGYRGVLEIREAHVLIGASAASQVGDWLYREAPVVAPSRQRDLMRPDGSA